MLFAYFGKGLRMILHSLLKLNNVTGNESRFKERRSSTSASWYSIVVPLAMGKCKKVRSRLLQSFPTCWILKTGLRLLSWMRHCSINDLVSMRSSDSIEKVLSFGYQRVDPTLQVERRVGRLARSH